MGMPSMVPAATRHDADAVAQTSRRVCMHVLGAVRTDRRVLREAATLRAAGWSVTIVDIEWDRHAPRSEEIEGIMVRHVLMPSWFVPTRFKPYFLVKAARALLAGAAALLRERAGLYHAHDTNALPACYLAARLRHAALIFDAHELPLVEPSITRWRRLTRLARGALRAMLRRCDGIMTVSPPIADEIQRRYGGPRAMLLRNIPNYQAPEPNQRLCERLGLKPSTRIALYQGNLQIDRGLDGLVHAARFLAPDIVLVLMGSGAIQPDLEALIAREHLGDRVRLLPPVPYAELLTWTASAHLGLIVYPPSFSPNVQMCLPNKLFEYLMAGVPVLASPLEAVSELLERYEVGSIVPSLEPEVVGAAMSALLADDAALARMCAHAREATRTDLRWEEEGRHLTGLYRALLPAGAPARAQASSHQPQ